MIEPDWTRQPRILPLTRWDLSSPVRSVFPNGTSVALLKKTVQEEIFRLDFLCYGGLWLQQMPLQAKLTHRMLGEGSRSMTQAKIAEKLDYYGAWLDYTSGVNVNILTLFSLNKYAAESLDILEKIIKEPTFPEQPFQVLVEHARQQYLSNSRKVETKARVAFNQMILGDQHPLARMARREDFDWIDTSALKSFYQQYYYSSNSALYLSGNPNKEVLRLVQEKFGREDWGRTSDRTLLMPAMTQAKHDKQTFIEVPDSVQSAVYMGFVSVAPEHADFEGLSALSTLLGGYFGSRLMSNIREDKGYTYGINSALVPLPFESIFVIVTQCGHSFVKPLIQEVYKEMERLRQETVTREELDRVKNYLLGELIRQGEGLSLSDVFVTVEMNGFTDDYMQQKVDAIRSLTSMDIQELANRYLLPDSVKEVVAGKNI